MTEPRPTKPPLDGDPGPFLFDAFLSYSRADAYAANRLKQAIERFAAPWYRARARRVFLDTATLAARGSLKTSIEDSLANSRALVLLASSASRKSQWVDKEVTWWLDHRGTDDLHLAILDGRIVWSRTEPEASAEPAALLDSWRSAFVEEPIWVDLRWMAGLDDVDRRDPRLTDAAAELLASIRGVPKDVVVGEHLRRRRQTRQLVTTVITTLLLLLVTAVASTVVAVNRRNVAIEQRYTATSRQLVAQSQSIEDERPSLARQLLLQADRLHRTEESVGALVRSPRMPTELTVEGSTPAVAVQAVRPLAAVLTGGALSLYETDSGRRLATVTDSVPDRGDVAFSPSGIGMAATTGEERVGLFDVSDPADTHQVAVVNTPTSPVKRVAYAGDGDVLIVQTDSSFIFYDVTVPANPVELTTVPVVEGKDGILLLDDGTLMSAAELTSGGVDTASLPVDVIVTPIVASNVTAVVTPDRQTLALAGSVGDVELWDIADRQHPVLRDSLSGESFGVDSLAFSDDGQVLAVGTPSGVTQLWDLRDVTRPVLGERLRGVSAEVDTLAFGSRSRQLVVVTADPVTQDAATGLPDRSIIRIWPVQGATRAGATGRIAGGRQAVPAWAPDTHSVIAGFPARSWLLDDPRNPRAGATLPTLAIGGGAAFAYQPGTSIIASGFPVVLWDATDPAAPRSLSEGTTVEEPTDLALFSPNGRVLAVGDQNRNIGLWSITSTKAHALARLPGSQAAPHGAAFGAGGKTLVALNRDGGATVWNVRDPAAPRVLSTVSRADDQLRAVAVDDRSGVLIAGGVRGALVAWDIRSPARPRWIGSRAAHTGAITGLALSPDRTILASAGEDAVRLWAREQPTGTLTPMATLDAGGIYNGAAVAFSPDGTLLAAATNGDMQIWDVDVGRLRGQLCAASEPISAAQWRDYLPSDLPYDPPCTGRG